MLIIVFMCAAILFIALLVGAFNDGATNSELVVLGSGFSLILALFHWLVGLTV